MAYTHTPIPFANSAQSVRKFGKNNSTRPRHAVLKYIEELWQPYLHLLSLGTTVEEMKKREDGKWIITLRRIVQNEDVLQPAKYMWWQEEFDAIVVASGHFTVPKIPKIPGLKEVSARFPDKFEHSKTWRSADNYVAKVQWNILSTTNSDMDVLTTLQKVIVVGGGVSAADLAEDLHDIVQDSLILSQRNELEFLRNAWNLPGTLQKPEITSFFTDYKDRVFAKFADDTVSEFDRVIFATGYRLSYPFLPFQAVTPENRLAGFYQHIFRISDPSLTVIGQVGGDVNWVSWH